MKFNKDVLFTILLASQLFFTCNITYAATIDLAGTDGPWTIKDFRHIPITGVDAHFGLDTGFASEDANGGLVFDLEIKVSDIVGGTADIAIDKDINNFTQFKWTDFHFDIGFGLGDDFVKSTDNDGFSFLTTPAVVNRTNDFSEITRADEDSLDFFGGNGVNIGDKTDYWLGIQVSDLDGDGMTTFTLRQRATVVEPSSLLLISLGGLFIVFLSTKKPKGVASFISLRVQSA